jgi:hypothetical protein
MSSNQKGQKVLFALAGSPEKRFSTQTAFFGGTGFAYAVGVDC